MAEAVDELSHASNAMKRKVDLQTEKGDGQPLMALRVQTPAKRQLTSGGWHSRPEDPPPIKGYGG